MTGMEASNLMTAATGSNISTSRAHIACLIFSRFVSKKKEAHSCELKGDQYRKHYYSYFGRESKEKRLNFDYNRRKVEALLNFVHHNAMAHNMHTYIYCTHMHTHTPEGKQTTAPTPPLETS